MRALNNFLWWLKPGIFIITIYKIILGIFLIKIRYHIEILLTKLVRILKILIIVLCASTCSILISFIYSISWKFNIINKARISSLWDTSIFLVTKRQSLNIIKWNFYKNPLIHISIIIRTYKLTIKVNRHKIEEWFTITFNHKTYETLRWNIYLVKLNVKSCKLVVIYIIILKRIISFINFIWLNTPTKIMLILDKLVVFLFKICNHLFKSFITILYTINKTSILPFRINVIFHIKEW